MHEDEEGVEDEEEEDEEDEDEDEEVPDGIPGREEKDLPPAKIPAGENRESTEKDWD